MTAPLGDRPQTATFCSSSGSTNSVLLRKPLADAMRLELWEIPGTATVSGFEWQPAPCRRAYVLVGMREPGYELDRVFAAEIWPDDRDDLPRPR